MVFPYTDVLEKTDDGFPFLPEAGNHKVKLKRVFVCVWVLKESYNSVFHTLINGVLSGLKKNTQNYQIFLLEERLKLLIWKKLFSLSLKSSTKYTSYTSYSSYYHLAGVIVSIPSIVTLLVAENKNKAPPFINFPHMVINTHNLYSRFRYVWLRHSVSIWETNISIIPLINIYFINCHLCPLF